MGKGKLLKAVLAACILFFFSCDDVLLSSPVSDGTDNSANTASSILSPQELSATHGGVKKIELSWKAVKGAYRYFIYAADNQFEQFEQIWETKSLNFTDTVTSGTSRYYKVIAENYAGVRSSFSSTAFGSSMASPVITSIETGSEGNSACVKWWMENCREKTYLNKINYIVTVYKEDKTTVAASTSASGSQNSVQIEGLSPKTLYYFEVEAYCTDSQNEVEVSGLIDAQTARKMIPDAPYELEAEKGISENQITLKWKLPEGVDVKTGNNEYTPHTLYFKVFRKDSDADESAYSEISQRAVPDVYESGAEFSYTDNTSLSRGKKYVYKVQSFVDGISKTVSSEKSAAETEGWLIGVPDFKARADYQKNEEGSIFTKITLSFDCTFENYGVSYSYYLRQKKTDLQRTSTETADKRFDSLVDLNNYVIQIDSPAEDSGYYSFELFTAGSQAQSADEAYTAVSAPGEFVVTENAGLIPVIEGFEVTGGYADGCAVSFIYNSSYKYTLKWMNVIDGENQGEESLELSESDLDLSGNPLTAHYYHPAVSGQSRIYILEANNNGITSQSRIEQTVKTLGTADIIFDSKSYDTISFSWKDVQLADSYEVTAEYKDVPSLSIIIDEEKITHSGDTNYCSIEKPSGWNNALYAGKPVTVKIVSKNSSTLSSSAAEKDGSLIGPALIETQAVSYDASSLTIRWKKAEGAYGYAAGRARCSDGTSAKAESTDTYFIKADGSEILVEGEKVSEERVTVTEDGDYLVLTDKYAETTPAETSQVSYKKNQSMLAWGLEYQYSVVPVLSEDDFVFVCDEENKKMILDSSSAVLYSNLMSVSAATTGWGLKVEASKAADGKKVTVRWNQPFGCSSKLKTPSVYYREYGTSGRWKYLTNTVASDAASLSLNVTPQSASGAYEFAVAYNTLNTAITLPASLEESFKTVMDEENSPEEELNKGYAMGLTGVYAGYAGDYTEQISWNPYDFDERKTGPDRYTLQVLNMNDSSDWVDIAEISVNKASGDYGTIAVVSAEKAVSAKIEQVRNGNSILQIKPVFDLNGGNNTSGVLKVLRDYKHYYRLKAERTYSDGTDEITVTSSVGDDYSAYGWRQVTDEELAKSALLALSYAFYLNDGGKEDYSNATKQFKYGGSGDYTDSKGGSAYFSDRAGATYDIGVGKYKHHFSFDGYSPEQLTPGGINASFLSLTQELSSCGIRGDADSYVYSFKGKVVSKEDKLVLGVSVGTKYTWDSEGKNYLTVKASDSETGTIYDAVITYSVPDEDSLKVQVTRGNNTVTAVDTDSLDVRKQWFPMQIHSQTRYEITNSDYGWWIK